MGCDMDQGEGSLSRSITSWITVASSFALCLTVVLGGPDGMQAQGPSGCCVCFEGTVAEPCNSSTQAACALQTAAGRQCFWTSGHTCSAPKGGCVPVAGDCTDDDDCDDGHGCTVDTCNVGTGACTYTLAADGTACSDGNQCTQSDTCQAGVCTGSNPVVCTPLDQCHVAGTCNPATGVCSNPEKPNGTTCNDGKVCTNPDTCQAGVCAGTPLNGTTCDDGNACTQTDACDAGTCTGSNPVVCTALDQCHVAGTCNPATGVCSNPEKSDGTACDDGEACTAPDTCQTGVCTGTAVSDGTGCDDREGCTDPDQCQSGVCTGTAVTDGTACGSGGGQCGDSCKGGQCAGGVSADDGTDCDDGNACTQTDSCDAGTCTGGNPVVCTALDQCHDVGTCNPATGVCSSPDQDDGTACDDGEACTSPDTCQTGVCTGLPLDGPTCDDEDACTDSDKCQAGVCAGDPLECTALDQCHQAGTCNPATGVCSNPDRPNGAACDDGNICIGEDACLDGICRGRTLVFDDPSCPKRPIPTPALLPWAIAASLSALCMVALLAVRRMRRTRVNT